MNARKTDIAFAPGIKLIVLCQQSVFVLICMNPPFPNARSAGRNDLQLELVQHVVVLLLRSRTLIGL